MECKVKKRWSRRKEARPQECLDAALDVFVTRGYAATRLDDIAKQAGISKGTLYLYFTSKEDLFTAVIRENVLPIVNEAENLFNEFEGSATEMFRSVIFAWWDRLGSTKLSGITKLMMAESHNFPEVAAYFHENVIVRAEGILEKVLLRGIASGEFRALDVRETINMVCASVVMLIHWKHAFGDCNRGDAPPHVYLNNFIDIFLRGVARTAHPTNTIPT